MDFDLNDEHRMVRDLVHNFAQKEIAPNAAANDASGFFDGGIIRKMGKLGLLGGPIPERYGGAGFDFISMAIICEEIERAETAFRVILSVHLGLNCLTLLQWGTEDQKAKYLFPQAKGDRIGAFGLTEPNAGSDAAAIQTTAVKDGDHYILNGGKTWISASDYADNFLIFATLDRDARHKGMCCFIVERTFEGFSSRPIHGKLGVRGGNTGQLFLEDVRVPKENLVGEEGEGFTIAMSALDWGRFTVGSGAVGLSQACLDASVKYAKERTAFGQPIGKYELVQQMIANMAVGAEASRLLCYRAGHLKNKGARNTRETSMAKWFACDVAFRSANDAIAIHGAYGYSSEYPVERYLRNARGAMIYEGTPQIHTIMQGEYALGYREDKPLRCPPPRAQAFENQPVTADR